MTAIFRMRPGSREVAKPIQRSGRAGCRVADADGGGGR